jgi:hypothetical protein
MRAAATLDLPHWREQLRITRRAWELRTAACFGVGVPVQDFTSESGVRRRRTAWGYLVRSYGLYSSLVQP